MKIEVLNSGHNRDDFNCGEDSLNNFLKRYARQQAERYLGRTFVAIPMPGDCAVMGYYTLAAGDIDASLISAKRIGLDMIPIVLLARLAVDNKFQGCGVGKRLLLDGLTRSQRIARAEIGAYAVVVDALNEGARQFYLRHGFQPLRDDPLHLYLTMKEIEALGLIESN